MDIVFARPVFLWLSVFIPLIITFHFYFLHMNQRKALRFSNFEALKRIAKERFFIKNNVVLILRVFVFLLLVIGLSQTIVYYDGARNDFDYVLAIDTSPSMVAEDISPNRLEAAKEAAVTFIENSKSSSEIGLVTFSGVTYVREPLSEDKLSLRISVESLNISRVSGTDIANAIVTSTNLLSSSENGKAIIIFTDGIDTAGAYIDDTIAQAVDYAKSQQIIIHTIGIGTEDSAIGYLPEIYNLTSSIDRDTLLYMSNSTGGLNIYPTSKEALIAPFRTLDGRTHQASIPVNVYEYALLLAAIFLLIEWILTNTRFRRVA